MIPHYCYHFSSFGFQLLVRTTQVASTGGRRIERVDISVDGGRSWQPTHLLEEVNGWTWRFWQAEVVMEAGEAEIVARAWDSAGNSQPQDISQVWNFKGYLDNA